MCKKILLLIFVLQIFSHCSILHRSNNDICNSHLFADIENARLNGLLPTSSPEQIKQQFPCFTGETEEGADHNFGGGVFFINHDFYFYTYHDYIEIRENFTGSFSSPLMGKSKAEISGLLGKPDYEQGNYQLYKRNYGTLRLLFGKSEVVVQISMHAHELDEVKRFCNDYD